MSVKAEPTAQPRALRPAERLRAAVPLFDIGVAAILALFSVLLLGLPYRQHLPNLPPFELAAVAALATTLPLAFRRRFAELVLVVVAIAYLWYLSLETQQLSGPSLALWVGLFSVGAYGRSRWGTPLRALVVAGIVGYVTLHVVSAAPQLGSELPIVLIATVTYNAFLAIAAWMMGDWFRQRNLYEHELDRRAQQLERNRLERERRVVQDERVRIARELHDVVAHHVSLMGIQAGAARTVLPESPDRAIETLSAIEASSRRAVEELHRLLGALRDESSDQAPGQVPRLRQLDELVESTRNAGLEPSLHVQGSPPDALPETLDLSAYRIVQEALTNVIKHARARRVDVEVTFSATAVDLRVVDDGQGGRATGASTAAASGRGLIGMRERAALFGGTLRAAPRPGGGFEVDAHLPIPS